MSHQDRSPLAVSINDRSELVDLGGRSLFVTSYGSGTPTVVFETGLGAESDEWEAVQRVVSREVRTVRYDRANRGLSSKVSAPRTAADMVDDLEAMLEKTNMAPPWVLVGHSFGGAVVRMLGRRRPSDVKGVALVDSFHPDQFEVFGGLFPAPFEGEPATLTSKRRFWTGGWRRPESTTEGLDFPAICVQDRALGHFGDLPIRIIVADTFLRDDSVPERLRPTLQARWNDLQGRFSALSTRARILRAEGVGHFVQRDSPSFLATALLQLVHEVSD